ncbi:NAD(P)H-dependent oxidoreductase, partial [Selenomonas sp.]
MKAAIVFDSRTHTTEKAAAFIAEGLKSIGEIEVRCFNIDDADFAYIQQSQLVVFGSPTYMASVTAKMKSWLESNAGKLKLAGKLGGAYATEQYIHGGAENAIQEMLVFM